MLLQILGPLRMGEVVLGGLNRRAVLGYLLLYPNQVVSTSKLLAAVWGGGKPASSRKILHNSVSGLRKALSAAAGAGPDTAVSLVTRDPGYQLNVDDQQIDYWRFRALVQRARSVQADNRFDQAATLLREGLGLWRGPVLSDLAEAGFQWPELAAAENTRLDAIEDYVDAELMRGRHESVLAELQAMMLAEPLRERLLSQFMLALYRCGRQAEALTMYEKAESTLGQTFGVEPGPELRELYRSIRADDAPLLFGRSVTGEGRLPVRHKVASARPGAEAELPGQTVAERRRVSVLQVRVDPSRDTGSVDPEHLDDALARVDEVIRPQVKRFGGVVPVRLGSHWLIVFGVPQSHHDDARRAVLCALAIRSALCEGLAGAAGGCQRMVVVTGLVLARFGPGTQRPPTVTGAAIDIGHSLLPFVAPNEIWVSDETRAVTANTALYQRARISSVMWVAVGIRPPRQNWPVPMIGHERARETLMGVVDRFLLHRTSEIVLVHGDPGMGKSRLLAEFARMATIRSVGHQKVLIVHLPVVLDDTSLAAALCRCCGITGNDLPEMAGRKLRDFIRRTADTPGEVEWMIAALQPLLHRTNHSTRPANRADRVAAWWLMLERIASLRPLVLILDDVEFAENRVLDFVDRIARPGHVASMLVVADARPTVAHHRPAWDEIKQRATSVTLLPLSETDMEILLDHLLEARGLVQKRSQRDGSGLAWLTRALVVACYGNPAFAHDYVSLIEEAVLLDCSGSAASAGGVTGVLPPVMERMTAERIDRIPSMARTVLQDAAVAGPAVWGDAVAAAGGWDREEVQPHLDELVQQGFLLQSETDPVGGDIRYEFRFPPDRHVVNSQLSLALRADKKSNVVAWIDGLPERRITVLLQHYRREERRITAMLDQTSVFSGEEPPADEVSGLGTHRALAGEAVRYYVALAEMPAWYRDRLRSVAGELRALRATGRRAVLTRVSD